MSPSQTELLRTCTLSALWTAQRVPRALPQSPAGRLGIVAHKLLEEAGEGKLTNQLAESFEARWEALVQAADASMERSWLERHLVSLRRSVADYEVRKI